MMRKAVGITVAVFVLGNLLLFLVYRAVFLWQFAEAPPLAECFRAVLYGLRLDCALLAIEMFGVGCLSMLLLRVRLDWWVRLFWCLSYVHALTCVANVACFHERNQHAGELLLAYITEPYQMHLAVLPFVREHPVFMALFLLLSVGFIVAGFRFSRRFRQHDAPLGGNARRIAWLVAFTLAPLLCVLEPIAVKKTKRASGWSLRFTHSKFYMRCRTFSINQAVPNPLHEIFRVHIPAASRVSFPYTLTEEQALDVCRRLLKPSAGNEQYPLLTRIRSEAGLGIRNAVLLQIEGLSRSVFEQELDGRPVMPFLRKLAREGLYFPNTYQSFYATSGGVFAAATSFHKCCFEGMTRRFVDYEVNGYYGCLPRVLGDENYTHYFCEGFAQSAADFVTFMKNQGFTVHDYRDFQHRLKQKAAGVVSNDLGVFDGYFLLECAEIIRRCPKQFTMQLMTATSHSPWTVPASFRRRFESPVANTFAYVDASVEAFVEEIRREPPLFDRTLFIIVADHTSVTLSDDYLDRRRIPLIFYNAKLALAKDRWKDCQAALASHVDILPTTLALLDGEHAFSGMGRNLLQRAQEHRGVLGGSNFDGFHLKDGFCFTYVPSEGKKKLFAVGGDRVKPEDVSLEHAEVFERLKQEYFAQYEAAKRLAVARRVFPQAARPPP